ncbi:hypothetical protein [Sorangium sp. So ce131]|uniref:hypothetical protein n=1 Tax=Sorangium sp. So ce131 TaxID=3133282 RepID=UPI003F5FCCE3
MRAFIRFCSALAGLEPPVQVGFRSVHPEAGGWNPFGPSDDAERRYAELLSAWAELEQAGVPDRYPHLRRQREFWVDFKARWEAGDPDVTQLTAAEADARTARAYVREHRPDDPRFAQARDPRGGDIEDARASLRAAAAVDRGAKNARDFAADAARAGWEAIPWWVKAGTAAAVVGAGYVASRVGSAYLDLYTGRRRVYR